jgi:hypothetical protein
METKKKVDDLMKEKFLCQAQFAQEVEKIAKDNNKIEIEAVSKLMSKPLKEKLKYDAQQLNFMKKTSRAKLPL